MITALDLTRRIMNTANAQNNTMKKKVIMQTEAELYKTSLEKGGWLD